MVKAARRDAEVIEVEIVDLGPRPSSPASTVAPPPIGRRPPWLIAVFLVPLAIAGLALIPGLNRPPEKATDSDSTLDSLGEPVVATTNTTLPTVAVAVMSDEILDPVPTVGLEGFVALAGPIEFGGRWWIAGNPEIYSSSVQVLASNDGIRWTVETQLSPGDGEWLRVDDLGAFGGALIAVGTVGQTIGPEYAPLTASNITLWKSSDGLRWSALPIAAEEGRSYSSLTLTTGTEEVLIGGIEDQAFDIADLEGLPSNLIPHLESGDLQLWTSFDAIHIDAPPGIEVLRLPRQQRGDPGSSDLFRSDNLMVWEELSYGVSAPGSLAAFDDGFVTTNANGQLVLSEDGESWRGSDRLPDLWYQSWEGRLVAIEYRAKPRIVIADNEGFTRVELPTEFATDQRVIWLTTGPSGLAATLQATMPSVFEPWTQTDDFVLTVRSGYVEIQEPSGEVHHVAFDTNGRMTGSYLAETNSVTVETIQGDRSFDLPLASLQELRWSAPEAGWEVAVSPDGLVWTRLHGRFGGEWVTIAGEAANRFLVLIPQFSKDRSRVIGLASYAVGPIG